MGLEVFFEDGSDFVVIVSEAEWLKAEKWDLDAGFGHVTVIAAEGPATDEGFDSGLGEIFPK